jgi:hypothetical protein
MGVAVFIRIRIFEFRSFSKIGSQMMTRAEVERQASGADTNNYF